MASKPARRLAGKSLDAESERIATIRALNDRLRCEGLGGTIDIAASIRVLGPEYAARVCKEVAEFDAFANFDEANDTHDEGLARIGDETFFWTIYCFDLSMQGIANDLADPDQTVRVLMIERAEEVLVSML